MTGVSHAAMSLLASEKNLIAISSSCSAQHANILPPLKSGSDWASLAQCLTNIAARLPPAHLPTRIGPSILPLCDAHFEYHVTRRRSSVHFDTDPCHSEHQYRYRTVEPESDLVRTSGRTYRIVTPAGERRPPSRTHRRVPLYPTLSGTSRSRAAPACSLPPGMVLTPGFMHV